MLHPHQRPLCALLVSLAVLSYFVSVKYKNSLGGDFFVVSENESAIFEKYFFGYNETNESQEGTFLFTKKQEKTSHTIYILGLFEISTKTGKTSTGQSEVNSAKLAIQHINSLNVLPGYNIELLVNDTKGDPGIAIDRFFHAIYSKKTVIMLLGSGYSNVTERIAHVVPYWNVLQVSFGSKSPALSDRQKFPLFFRTVAPDSSHNLAKIKFIRHFSWNVVATFSQSGNAYLFPVNKLVKELERVNITCKVSLTFSLDNYKEQLLLLKNQDVRIIIGSFSDIMAAKIFCATKDIGMYGTEYVWILQGHNGMWWLENKECSEDILKESMDRIFMFYDYYYVENKSHKIVSILENNTILESNLFDNSIETNSKYTRETYDAVWSMALAMRKSLSWTMQLENFTYSSKDMVCRFIYEMENLKFIGVSGPVSFKGADRIGNSIIRQFQEGQPTDVAIYDSIENNINFNCKSCSQISWKGGQTPMAQRIIKIDLITIPAPIFYTVVTVSLMGICVSVLFFYFNLKFRRMKTVKISSPNLNNVAVFGCIFVYVSVILFALNNAPVEVKYYKEFCTIRIYFLSAGFSLAFGSMIAKTYRVQRLFVNNVSSLVKDKLLMDKQLISLILIPLFVDGLISGLWVFTDPMERQLHNLSLKIGSTNRGIVIQSQIEVCKSTNTIGWYTALFGYKSLILILGLYMAWKTRHVKVVALNESQYIGICVYSAVFCAIIVALSAFISKQFIVSYLARTISILTATTIVLLLLFLSKIKCVFGRVNAGDSLMQSMGLKFEYNTRRFILNDHRERIYRLEVRNKVHRAELESLEREIFKLEEQLLQTSTSDSAKSSFNAIETVADCHLNVPCGNTRASWPHENENSFNNSMSRKEYFSDNKLYNENFFDKFNFFGKLKRIFGSISSLHRQQNYENYNEDYFRIPQIEKRSVIRSNPEFYSQLLVADPKLSKVKSEIHIKHCN